MYPLNIVAPAKTVSSANDAQAKPTPLFRGAAQPIATADNNPTTTCRAHLDWPVVKSARDMASFRLLRGILQHELLKWRMC